jgi:hypothetical protein
MLRTGRQRQSLTARSGSRKQSHPHSIATIPVEIIRRDRPKILKKRIASADLSRTGRPAQPTPIFSEAKSDAANRAMHRHAGKRDGVRDSRR